MHAVRNLTLSIEQGQVFALLGHNGAGKTTLIKMLTGLLRPTRGDAFIFGTSVSRQMEELRQCVGVCPQFDLLWNELNRA